MPRYFFHVRLGQVTLLDRHGVELADVTAAANEAARRIRDIAAAEALNPAPAKAAMIIIDDDWGTLLEMPFAEQNERIGQR